MWGWLSKVAIPLGWAITTVHSRRGKEKLNECRIIHKLRMSHFFNFRWFVCVFVWSTWRQKFIDGPSLSYQGRKQNGEWSRKWSLTRMHSKPLEELSLSAHFYLHPQFHPTPHWLWNAVFQNKMSFELRLNIFKSRFPSDFGWKVSSSTLLTKKVDVSTQVSLQPA